MRFRGLGLAGFGWAGREDGHVSTQGERYQRSASGMVGAMLVLLAIVVAFVLLRDLNRNDPEGPGAPVDYRQIAGFAAEQAPFEVLAPERLPEGWRATSVGYTPEPPRWHLGLLTGEGDYVGLEQAESTATSLVTTYVDEAATRDGEIGIDGRTWEVWTDDGGDTALVDEGEAVTTLVVGPVDQDLLAAYVRRLR